MNISKTEILTILEKFEIDFSIKTKIRNDKFRVSSIFKPINNGFYFFNGTRLPITTINSLFIVHNSFDNFNGSNDFIVLKNRDPQTVYYKILDFLFQRKSNGNISINSNISNQSKIGKNVQIDAFCVIEAGVTIGNDVIIGSGSKIHKNTFIGNDTIIESSSIIGTQGVAWVWDEEQKTKLVQPQLGGVEIGDNCFLGANTIIVRGSLNENTYIGHNSLFAPGCRIGHGSIIGNFAHLANSVCTGGNINIGNNCFLGSGSILRPKVKLHQNTIVGAGALVVKNTTKENLTLMGVPAKESLSKINPSGMPKPKI